MNKKAILAACLAMFACACQQNNTPNKQPDRRNDQPSPCSSGACPAPACAPKCSSPCPSPCPAPAPRGGCCETEKKAPAAPVAEQKAVEQKAANANVATPEVKVETKTP